MNYKVEDLSSLTHADDLMSGFVNPDRITYGANGRINPRSNQERKSSAEGEVDVEGLTKFAIDLTGQVIGAVGSKKTELERAIKASCGNRRLQIGKKSKEAYRVCASGVLQSFSNSSQNNNGRSGSNNNSNEDDSDNESKGLSTGAVVGIVLGIAVVGTAIVLAVKYANKP